MREHEHRHAPRSDEKIHSYYQMLGLAIKELLIEKGIITPGEIRAMIEQRDSITPAMGAKIVARAWIDPAYRQRLMKDGSEAIGEFGLDMATTRLVVVENTRAVHNVIVCTLCSCYPRNVLGLPPSWYKNREYRARAVREPRAVLSEFGLIVPEAVDIDVWDSTAETRYLVLPVRPDGTDGLAEDELAALVTRDGLIGTARV